MAPPFHDLPTCDQPCAELDATPGPISPGIDGIDGNSLFRAARDPEALGPDPALRIRPDVSPAPD